MTQQKRRYCNVLIVKSHRSEAVLGVLKCFIHNLPNTGIQFRIRDIDQDIEEATDRADCIVFCHAHAAAEHPHFRAVIDRLAPELLRKSVVVHPVGAAAWKGIASCPFVRKSIRLAVRRRAQTTHTEWSS